MQEQMLLQAGKVKRHEAEISTLREAVRLAKAEADGRGEQASKAHTATRCKGCELFLPLPPFAAPPHPPSKLSRWTTLSSTHVCVCVCVC